MIDLIKYGFDSVEEGGEDLGPSDTEALKP